MTKPKRPGLFPEHLKLCAFLIFLFLSGSLPAQNAASIIQLENALKADVPDTVRIKARLELIQLYSKTDQAKAGNYLVQLAEDIDEDKYPIASKWIFEVGNLYYNFKNDHAGAIKYFMLAMNKAEEEKDNLHIYYECWLGYLYSNIGEHENARKHLLHAIETAENRKIDKYLPFAYLAYGFELRNSGEIKKASESFRKSYEKSSEIGDSTYIHVALHETGNIYSMQKDYQSAIKYHIKALTIREKLSDPQYLMYSYNDIAVDFYSIDSIHTALKYYLKAEKLAREGNNKYTLFKILQGAELAYTAIEKYDKSAQYLSEMRAIADELKIKNLYSTLYDRLYFHNKALGNYKDAMENLELSIIYRDSVSSEEIQKNLNDLDKKYEIIKKDKEILENQSYIKRQNIVIIFSAIGLLALAVFITIGYRQYREKREAFRILEIQNQEILQQSEELKKLNIDKDRFISILAHDLRNPFNAILGFSDLLLENLRESDMEEIEDQIRMINRISHQTYQLLEQLLLWAKSQSGKLTIVPQVFGFSEAAGEIISMFENQAGDKEIEIYLSDAEKLTLNTDRNVFQAVIRNLISNAIKFSHRGGQVRVSAVKDPSQITITVSDNGVGIEEENIPKLWGISETFTTPGTSNEKGTGLGLKLCKELVEKLGGNLWVESEVGKGSAFRFTLPHP